MSSLESIRQTVATQSVVSPVGVEVMAEVQGKYRGERVAVTSESSKLADAAEEIGMSVAHRVDRKSLGQREVRQGQGTSLNALARIADYYDKLPDMPRETKLVALVKELQTLQDLLEGGGSGGGGVTKEDVLAALAKFDGDVTHQFAALEIAREHFEATGGSEQMLGLLDAARGYFETGDVARDVRAGFVIAELANRDAATLETDPAAVRDRYRAMLRETPSFAQLFEGLKQFDLSRGLTAVIDVFREAAGRDLASTGPSSDPGFLHALITELSKLKKLQSVLDLSQQMMASVGRLIPQGQRDGLDGTSVTGRLLAFTGKAVVNLSDARALLGPKSDQMSPETRLALANGLRNLHGEIPDELMPSPQARLQQAATIVTLLDGLVEEEDEAFTRREEEKRRSRNQGHG